MSLKTEFNCEVTSYCKRTGTRIAQVKEPKLVEILVEILNRQPGISSKMYHQRYVNFSFVGNPIRRELCDTLLIVKHNHYLRVSFIQNKKKLNKYGGLGEFEINCGQHYLLQKKPAFTPTAGSGIIPAVSRFIQDSIYDTVTAYSVFYCDESKNIDLDLASSCSVICSKPTSHCGGCSVTKSSANHLFSKTNYNRKNTYIDYDSHSTLDEIVTHNEFGEVVEFGDFHDKLDSLISFFHKGSVYEFLGISKDTHEYIDHLQTDRIKSFSGDIYYYIPKIVLIDIGNDNKDKHCVKNQLIEG